MGKIFSKLTPRRKSGAKYKAVQEKTPKEGGSPSHPQQYQRLIDCKPLATVLNNNG